MRRWPPFPISRATMCRSAPTRPPMSKYAASASPGASTSREAAFRDRRGLGLMDFETAAKLSGARFVVLKGQLARLERALGSSCSTCIRASTAIPRCTRRCSCVTRRMFGTAQLPKFAEDQFRTTDGRWLIPTAEVPLTNLVRERSSRKRVLPLRFTALDAVLPLGSGGGGPRHPRHDAPASVRQGRDGVDHHARAASLDEHERMTAAPRKC
jgi:seryl-tRNA synthetase